MLRDLATLPEPIPWAALLDYELNPAGAAPKWAARIAGTPSTFNPARIFPAQEAVDSSDNPACPIQTTAACALDTPTWFRPGLTLTRLLREAELLVSRCGALKRWSYCYTRAPNGVRTHE